jgi:hypothetical protein
MKNIVYPNHWRTAFEAGVKKGNNGRVRNENSLRLLEPHFKKITGIEYSWFNNTRKPESSAPKISDYRQGQNLF